MSERRLSKKALNDAWDHYTGNCFSCERCTLFEAVRAEEPGAVEAYVRYMRDTHGTTVKTVPAKGG